MKTYDATNTSELGDIISEAIAYSRSHNEIVRVIVKDEDREAAESEVNSHSESYDSTDTEDVSTGKPMTDVWGDDGQGGEFRLYLVTQ